MNLLTIDGVSMPNPTQYGVPTNDLDSADTKRTESGKLKRKRVRAGILKINLTWSGISIQDVQIISAAVQPAELSVTFFDPWSFNYQTKTMYASAEKNAEAKIIKDVDDSRWNVSFSLSEY
jgi:hypothetical protein